MSTGQIYNRLYDLAEDAFAAELPLPKALQAVRDGYSSAEIDRRLKEERERDEW